MAAPNRQRNIVRVNVPFDARISTRREDRTPWLSTEKNPPSDRLFTSLRSSVKATVPPPVDRTIARGAAPSRAEGRCVRRAWRARRLNHRKRRCWRESQGQYTLIAFAHADTRGCRPELFQNVGIEPRVERECFHRDREVVFRRQRVDDELSPSKARLPAHTSKQRSIEQGRLRRPPPRHSRRAGHAGPPRFPEILLTRSVTTISSRRRPPSPRSTG